MAAPLPEEDQKIIDEIYEFWTFGDDTSPHSEWFYGGKKMDVEITERFKDIRDKCAAGECDHWQETPKGTLALLLCLDQFSRHIYRKDAESYAADAKCLEICEAGIAKGFMDEWTGTWIELFWILPIMHQEDMECQKKQIAMLEARPHLGLPLLFGRKHYTWIEKFGRFPGRNEDLGRETTAEEKEFQSTPMPKFEKAKMAFAFISTMYREKLQMVCVVFFLLLALLMKMLFF